MVSGFFGGGFSKGFESGFNTVNTTIYDQGLLKIAQQRLQNERDRQIQDQIVSMQDSLFKHIDADKIAPRNGGNYDPKSTYMSISSNVDGIADLIAKTGGQNGPQLAAMFRAQVAAAVNSPSSAAIARGQASATGELQKTQAQTKELQERAGYYKRGGLPEQTPEEAVATYNDTSLTQEQRVGLAPLPAKLGQNGSAPISDAATTDQGSSVLRGLARQAGMLPESLDVAGRALAGGNTSVLQNLGRGKQGGEAVKAVRAWAAYSLMHDQHLTAAQAADQLNFNTQNYKGQTAAQQTLGRRSGQFALAENEFEQIADLVSDASKNVPRTQYKTINDVMNAWREQTGDPNIVQLGAAINSAVNVYARAINPTGQPTVSDKDHAREILQRGWADGQVDAAIEQLRKEVAAAKRAIPAAQKELRGQSGSQPKRYKFNPDTGELE